VQVTSDFSKTLTTAAPVVNHWAELRLAGSIPERRSYHSTFTYEKKIYIYGGLDILNGSVSTLWELDTSNLKELDSEESDVRSQC
jgi:hypothetical protein